MPINRKLRGRFKRTRGPAKNYRKEHLPMHSDAKNKPRWPRLAMNQETEAHKIARLELNIQDLRDACIQKQEIIDGNTAIIRDAYTELHAYRSLKFPTMLRKMWSGEEVEQWLKDQHARIRESH